MLAATVLAATIGELCAAVEDFDGSRRDLNENSRCGGQPAKGRNTEILMREALQRAHEAGCETMFRIVPEAGGPCDACAGCFETGSCVIQDDMHELYSMLDSADEIIIGSPVYFGSVSAQTKAIMDRMFSLLRRRALKGKVAGSLAHQSSRNSGSIAHILLLRCPRHGVGWRCDRLRKRNWRCSDGSWRRNR